MTGRILVVDAIPTNRIVLRVKLSTACYDVAQVASIRDALAAMHKQAPDLILTAADLPDMQGLAAVRALHSHPLGRHVPLIVIAGRASPSDRLALLSAGADDVMERPVDDTLLLARMRSLLRARAAEAELNLREDTRRALGFAEDALGFDTPARLTCVPLGASADDSLAGMLQSHLALRVASQSQDHLLRTAEPAPDVILLDDRDAGSEQGLQALPQLRAHAATRLAALVYLVPKADPTMAARALDMGADDVVACDAEPAELALRIQRQITRKRTADKLRANMHDGLRAAMTDPLTGLYNRRYALPHVDRIAERAAARGRSYALLLADLDHFKTVNDRYGHAAGDAVLIALAERLRHHTRPSDLIARYGGEEFLIVMPDATRNSAKEAAMRLCQMMTDTPVRIAEQDDIAVTLSIGVSIGRPDAGVSPRELIERADAALYAAKAQGRNAVVMADTVTPMTRRRPAAAPVALPRAVNRSG